MAKLQMVEFCYDFLDKYISRQDLRFCYIDTLNEIFKPGLRHAYETGKRNWVTIEKISERTPALLKPEFVGIRCL